MLTEFGTITLKMAPAERDFLHRHISGSPDVAFLEQDRVLLRSVQDKFGGEQTLQSFLQKTSRRIQLMEIAVMNYDILREAGIGSSVLYRNEDIKLSTSDLECAPSFNCQAEVKNSWSGGKTFRPWMAKRCRILEQRTPIYLSFSQMSLNNGLK